MNSSVHTRQSLTPAHIGLWLALAALLLGGCSRQAKLQRSLERGDRFYQRGHLEKARIEYLNALRLERSNIVAAARLGEIFHEQGAPLQAFPLLLAASKRLTNDTDLACALASVYGEVGDNRKARDLIVSVLDRTTTNDQAVVSLAELAGSPQQIADARARLVAIRLRSGDRAAFDLAEAVLLIREQKIDDGEKRVQSAIAKDPKFAAAHLAMSGLYFYRSNFTMAEQALKKAAELSKPHSYNHIRYAEFKVQQGQIDDARKYLEDRARQTPDYLPFWWMLARLAVTERKYADATKYADRVLAGDRLNYEARTLRGRIKMLQGNGEGAIQDFNNLANAFPFLPEPRVLLAQAYLATRKPDLALAQLDRAIAINTNFVDALLMKAGVLLNQGEAKSVVTSMRSLLARTNVLGADLLLASAYRQLDQRDNALAVYRRLAAARPKDANLPFQIGLTLREQKKPAEARAAFQESWALAPGNLQVLEQLVEIDLATTNGAAALNLLRQQLAGNPTNAVMLMLEARIHTAEKRYADAETILRKVIELAPDATAPYYSLASLYSTQHKLPQAISELERWLTKSPKDPRALMMAAAAYSESGNYAKAGESYERLLALNPNFVPALNNLAYLYSEHFKNPEKAYDFARKAADLAPGDPAIADTLGWTLFRRGQYQQALPVLRDAAEKLPDNAEVHYHLGATYYMLGQTESAKNSLRQALGSAAMFPGRDDAQRRLAAIEGTGGAAGTSIAEIESYLKEHPDDVPARVRLAELYQRGSQPGQAAKHWLEVLRINPRNAPAALRVAQLYAGPLKDNAKATEWARKAHDLAPEDAEATLLLGRLAYESRDYALAAGLLWQSARHFTNRADVLHDFAWAAYSVGRVHEAEESMRTVVRIEPDTARSTGAKWFLAMTAIAENPQDSLKAEAQVNELLKSSPNHAAALMAQGAILARRGDATQAASIYEKLLVQRPTLTPAVKELAILYAAEPGREAKAYELATKARQAFPNDSRLAVVLGKLAYNRKDYSYAITVLGAVISAIPNDVESLFRLGMSYHHTKDPKRAEAALQKCVAAGLKEPMLTEARRILGAAGKP